MMGDRATLEKIFAIMRRLLLIRKSGLDPIPVKGTTRHECYRALYEIQELLETRRYFGRHLPQTHADRIRAITDEELAEWLETIRMYCANDLCGRNCPLEDICYSKADTPTETLAWLKEEA